MANSTYANFLTECGFEVNKSDFIFLDEANQVQVTDEALTGMMKFITDKYNSIDFSEIEKSAGDYGRFKYGKMLEANLRTLKDIYEVTAETDKGADKYLEVVNNCFAVIDLLYGYRTYFTTLYKSKFILPHFSHLHYR